MCLGGTDYVWNKETGGIFEYILAVDSVHVMEVRLGALQLK